MTIYLAGKISGDPNYKEKFKRAARQIEKLFGPVLNPAQRPEGLSAEAYMQLSFSDLGQADAAVFLPDWKDSAGARLEHDYCAYVGKPILYLKDGTSCCMIDK